MDEQAFTSRGGLLQFIRFGNHNHSGIDHRNCRVEWDLEGQRLKGILFMHLVLGCVSSLLIWIVWLIHVRTLRKQRIGLPGYRLPIEAVAVAVVALTGHLGGFLSGVN
jgi:hypothetical protein